MAIPTERVSGAIDIQLRALNSGGVMTDSYPITVVEDVIGLQPAVQRWIADYGSIKFEVWDQGQLPGPGVSGAYNTIYLVPAEGGTLNDYDEYIYVSGEPSDHWEIIGNTQADVSNKMNKSGTYTNNHILLGLSGGTAIDGGKYLGSATFNGTSSNYMAREDGVVNYVSGRLHGTSDHVVAFSGGGRLKDTGKLVGGSTFVDPDEAPATYLATEAGVRAFMSTTDAADSLPIATPDQRGTVYFADTLDIAGMGTPSATAPSVAAVNSALALTQPRLTFNAPLVSGANNAISINMATTTSSGAVVLTTTPSASGGIAATPALVSTALNGTSDHVVAYSAGGKLKDTGKVVGGATFAATPNASTLATEAGVSAYVASASPKAGLAGYTAASSGVMYVVSSGGALTITSGGLDIQKAGYYVGDAESEGGYGVIALTSDEYDQNGLSLTNGVLSMSLANEYGGGGTGKAGAVYIVDYYNTITHAFDPAGQPAVPTQDGLSAYVLDHLRHGTDEFDNVVSPVYIADKTHWGVVKIGSYIDVADGTISVSSAAVNGSAGVVKLVGTVGNVTSAAITPAGVSSYVSSLAAGISAIAPLNDNITATGGTISISSATATQSGAVLIMSGGTFTNAANKVATEGAVFSNCIFYSIV